MISSIQPITKEQTLRHHASTGVERCYLTAAEPGEQKTSGTKYSASTVPTLELRIVVVMPCESGFRLSEVCRHRKLSGFAFCAMSKAFTVAF